jgi:CRISPR-associated protein Cmr4
MYKTAKPFYIQTVTPTHVGSGSDLGIVDMPIQRESHTGFPKIEGSSLKGAIREAVENKCEIFRLLDKQKEFEKKYKNEDEKDKKVLKELKDIIEKEEDLKKIFLKELKINTVFGFDNTNVTVITEKKFGNNKDKFAGAIGFSDARVLLFPVKSVKGVYAYITSPMVIQRYMDELKNIAQVDDEKIKDLKIPKENAIPVNSKIKLDDENVVILEEYSFEVTQDIDGNGDITKLANFLAEQTGINEIKEKLIVLDDNDFKDFIKMFTEVITRTKIDNFKGAVKDGALFTEEYLPAETIMYSFIMASPIMADIEELKDLNNEKDVLEFFKGNCPDVIQIGGNATIGKGICKIVKDSLNG